MCPVTASPKWATNITRAGEFCLLYSPIDIQRPALSRLLAHICRVPERMNGGLRGSEGQGGGTVEAQWEAIFWLLRQCLGSLLDLSVALVRGQRGMNIR